MARLSHEPTGLNAKQFEDVQCMEVQSEIFISIYW